jgi:hypothetical protein
MPGSLDNLAADDIGTVCDQRRAIQEFAESVKAVEDPAARLALLNLARLVALNHSATCKTAGQTVDAITYLLGRTQQAPGEPTNQGEAQT